MFQALLKWATLQYFAFLLVALFMFSFWFKYNERAKTPAMTQKMRELGIDWNSYESIAKKEGFAWLPRTAYNTIFQKFWGLDLGWEVLSPLGWVPMIISKNLFDEHTVFENMDLYSFLTAERVSWGRHFPQSVYQKKQAWELWMFVLSNKELPTTEECSKERREKAKIGEAWGYMYSFNKDYLKKVSSSFQDYSRWDVLFLNEKCNFVKDFNWQSKGFLMNGYLGLWPFLTLRQAYEYAEKTQASGILRLYDGTIRENQKAQNKQAPEYNQILNGMEYLVIYKF